VFQVPNIRGGEKKKKPNKKWGPCPSRRKKPKPAGEAKKKKKGE